MLSLTSSDVPLVYKNHLCKLVTSLPYVDGDADELIKLKVERMVKQEMARMERKDYLADLPMPETKVLDSPLIHAEIQRVKQHDLLEEPLLLQLPIIDLSTADISHLRQFNEKANTISQYNSLRQINLELMIKYGPDAHKIFIEYQNLLKGEITAQNNALRVIIDHNNSKRKYEQSLANDKLSNYQYKIGNLLRKNEEIEIECLKLENEVLLMRKKQLKLQ